MHKILTLIITGAILYMIFQQNMAGITIPDHLKNQSKLVEKQNQENEVSGTFLEKTLSSVMINILKSSEGRMFMESMLQPMNKAVAGSGSGFEMNNDNFIKSLFRIRSFGEGTVGPVSCGHVVTVHYKILGNDSNVLEDKVATFTLGTEQVAPGLDAVIVGMKIGETRHAVISNKYFMKNADDKLRSFKVNVLLKEVIPQNFIDDSVKIFDDQIAYQVPLVCGNKVIYDAKITNLTNNEIIYNSESLGKKINMKIGNLNYPMIFSHALHNKIPVGTRTIIAKGKFLKSYISDNSAIFPNKVLNIDDYFMIELYNFDNPTKPMTFPYKEE